MANKSKVFFLILSEDIATLGANPNDKKTILYQPFFTKKMNLPAKLPFTFTMGIQIAEPANNNVTAEFRDPSGNTLSTVIISDIILNDEENLQGIELYGANISASTKGVNIEVPGEHHFVVLSNEVELFRTAILIKSESETEDE